MIVDHTLLQNINAATGGAAIGASAQYWHDVVAGENPWDDTTPCNVLQNIIDICNKTITDVKINNAGSVSTATRLGNLMIIEGVQRFVDEVTAQMNKKGCGSQLPVPAPGGGTTPDTTTTTPAATTTGFMAWVKANPAIAALAAAGLLTTAYLIYKHYHKPNKKPRYI